MIFDEGRARNRKDRGPKSLTIGMKLALYDLQSARKDIYMRRKRMGSGWSDEFARSIIGEL